MMNFADISITNNIDTVKEILLNNDMFVIDMSEDDLLPKEHPKVIGGSFLLPPIDALIAEADGDFESFNYAYTKHFESQDVDEFVGALITTLYNNKNLVLFYPTDNEFLIQQLVYQLFIGYGIKPGVFGISPAYYSLDCIPIWLNLIFSTGSMDPMELLKLYPEGVEINIDLMTKILFTLKPYGNTTEEKIETVYRLVHLTKISDKVIVPFRGM